MGIYVWVYIIKCDGISWWDHIKTQKADFLQKYTLWWIQTKTAQNLYICKLKPNWICSWEVCILTTGAKKDMSPDKALKSSMKNDNFYNEVISEKFKVRSKFPNYLTA